MLIKQLILLVGLMIASLSFTQGGSYSWKSSEWCIEKLYFDVDNAINELKTKELYLKRDFREIDSLAYNTIYKTVDDSLVSKFKLSKKDLVICIETLAITEGSIVTKRGLGVFKSSLFLLSNNPFGIKGLGHVAVTTEYINGIRVKLPQSFKSFSGLSEAVNHLLELLIRRYNMKEVTTRRGFFLALKAGGYFTASDRYLYTLNSISEDIAALHYKP